MSWAAEVSVSTEETFSRRYSGFWDFHRKTHRKDSVPALTHLSNGVPPHGGLAFGFDRIIMLGDRCNKHKGRNRIPKVKDASCPLTNAPDVVDAKQLDELGITVKEEEVTEE